ncbi:hypothetical protein KP509_18G029500 [Ceratopteris richardii]|uniref:4-coumarate--CoA ligase n=1 Tax=Ceratopteris richardii TaxID=49495 RepID=A0A8T2SNH1_CERRI|nr:hypothetical protein KP509_18G029500 [Ceratopteris richardii]
MLNWMAAPLIDSRSGFCAETGIYYSKRPLLPLPSTSELSLPAFLRQQSCSTSSDVAYIDFANGSQITYAQLHDRIKAVAAGLALLLRVQKGDVLLILAPNSIQFIVLVHAALSIGVVVTTSNPVSRPIEIIRQSATCSTKFIATTASLAHKVAELRLPLILLEDFPPRSISLPQHVPFGRLVSADADSLSPTPVYQEDAAMVLFSSGTTGFSKGVVITHRNLIAQAVLFWHRKNLLPDCTRRVDLCFVPLFHAYGLIIFGCAAIGKGLTVVLLPKFDMVQMLLAIEKHRVTNLSLVPPVMLALVKTNLTETYDLSSLRIVSVGAAPVSKDLITAFKSRFPCVIVLQGYGLTESTAVGANSLTVEESEEFRSTGLIASNMEAKIVDVDSKKPLPPNHSGEIWLRGPVIMKGYLDKPEETERAVDKEGWLHTGDLGYIDSDGFLFIIDRLKELIKYNGYQVAPAELEALLLSHPHIQDAAVVPYPDEEAGQIPEAYVVITRDSLLSAREVMDFISEQVSPHKKIRRVTFVSEIPKSPSGKILRRLLTMKAASKL